MGSRHPRLRTATPGPWADSKGDRALRDRDRIIESLETVYRSAFEAADRAGDRARMEQLDFDFQRDQVFLEVLLDARELLYGAEAEEGQARPSLIERAKAIKDLTKLR
jgi:hypothetical protein